MWPAGRSNRVRMMVQQRTGHCNTVYYLPVSLCKHSAEVATPQLASKQTACLHMLTDPRVRTTESSCKRSLSVSVTYTAACMLQHIMC